MQRLSLYGPYVLRPTAIWHVAALMLLGASLVVSGCEKPRETSRDETVQTPAAAPEIVDNRTAPTAGLPKLIDLGAGKCIPCKKMAPILEELKEEYAGVWDVVFVDVWQNPDAGKKYNIEMIPTQIFYDGTGKEFFHHITRRSFSVKSCTMIHRGILAASLVLLSATMLLVQPAPLSRAEDKPAVAPSHQVVACYFHRTNRCPTCKKISAYIEESVQTGFESQVKEGSVKVVMVDFQNAKNQKMTEAYKITGPTLVLLDIHDGKVKAWKAAPKVWSLVSKKDEFFKYVQQEVKSYLDGERTAAR